MDNSNYQSPRTGLLLLETEQVLCASGDLEELTWGYEDELQGW